MRKFIIQKLVRDKILENILSNKKNSVDFYKLDKESFLKNLKNKFLEEIEELNFDNETEAVKELADLQLIIDSCLEVLSINEEKFKEIYDKKNTKNGKFEKKIFIKTVELDEQDEWVSYYEKKYKEVK